MEKKTNFFKRHAVLLVGIALYLIVYIISCNYDPWDNFYRLEHSTADTVDLYTHDVLSGNSIIEKIPADILFYGIAEAAVLMENGVFALLALVTFGMVFMGYWVESVCEKNDIKKLEMFVIDHLYGNVLLYILSVIIAKIMESSEFGLHTVLEFLTPDSDTSVLVVIFAFVGGLLAIAFTFIFVFLPMLPIIIYFFGYLLLSDRVVDLIQFLDITFFGNVFGETFFPREVLAFLTAFIILIVFNILLERIYAVMQKYSIYPAYRILLLFRRSKKRKLRRDENACKKNNPLS